MVERVFSIYLRISLLAACKALATLLLRADVPIVMVFDALSTSTESKLPMLILMPSTRLRNDHILIWGRAPWFVLLACFSFRGVLPQIGGGACNSKYHK